MTQTDPAFLRQAELIGAKICRKALWSGDHCYWQDYFMHVAEDEPVSVQRPIGLDIYSGASGIAFFLAALYLLAPEKRFRSTAESSAKLTLTQIENLGSNFPVGFYIGYVGIAVALIKLGEVFRSDEFIAGALRIIHQISEREIGVRELDVISGAAGAIPALLTVHEKYPDGRLLHLAVKYGEHLIDFTNRILEHTSFTGPQHSGSQPRSYTGFSHGDAGIGWALLELSSATGIGRFAIAADGILSSQQGWFDWLRKRLDDREVLPAQNPRHFFSWCHGAVGLAVSRLRAYELTLKQIYKDEAETALRATMAALNDPQSHSDYSLCHGVAGAGDALVYASKVLHDTAYKDAALHKGLQGIEQVGSNRLPWPCGSPCGTETLSLMQGVAGIGYFYLRLCDPENTPPLTIILSKRRIAD